jgi:hypothetical protein
MTKIFLITLTLMSSSLWASVTIDFSNELKKYCTDYSPIKSKKILLAILKSERSGENPCNNPIVVKLSESCKKSSAEGEVCSQIYSKYQEVKASSEGTVVGDR